MTVNGKRVVATVAVIALGLVAWDSFFIINETQQGVLTHFGKISPPVRQPGFHLKWPRPISRIFKVDRRIHTLKDAQQELITEDQKSILIDGYVLWRVVDPILFVEAIRTSDRADERLRDLYLSSSGIIISNKARDAFIGLGLEHEDLGEASREILSRMAPIAKENYGIEVLRAGIVEYTLPVENRPSVIERMISERARIAARYRSEGEEMAIRIEALAINEHEKLLADARAEATTILLSWARPRRWDCYPGRGRGGGIAGQGLSGRSGVLQVHPRPRQLRLDHRQEHDAHVAGRVRLRAPRSRRRLAPARQRLGEQEDRRRAGALVFVVDAQRAVPGGGQRAPRLAHQLHRLLVHAQHRPSGVVGPRVGVQHPLHVRRELGVGLRRNHPVRDLASGDAVFFNVRRTVS